jgi:2-desacetyl-2-hydroxyethyl bacteriochlorophyllide A dehydrogenase
MQAAVLTLDGFVLEELARPAPGPQEVLIRTIGCGVCSGDVFVYQNRADFVATYNRLGHEPSGEVVAVGSEVTEFQPGDIVTALAMGAYSDYFTTEAARVVKLPPQVDPLMALGEAVACCVHAANRFGTKPGDKVAVIGCGFMGLICQQLAIHQGAAFVLAVDPVAERREMAVRMGAQVTADPTAVAAADLLAAHGEFDVVIEAAGVQSAVDLSTELVCQHGKIILVGYHQSNNGMRTVNMQQWNFKAIDVINGHVRRQDEKKAAMAEGMALLAAGKIDTAPLVTVYDFADTERAFQELSGGKPGLFKAVLRMEGEA